jgi:hypothetical protein
MTILMLSVFGAVVQEADYAFVFHVAYFFACRGDWKKWCLHGFFVGVSGRRQSPNFTFLIAPDVYGKRQLDTSEMCCPEGTL